MKKIEERNRALLSFVLLPLLFLTVALLGGLRVSAGEHAFVFVPPPLVTLILAALLMLLFSRGSLVVYGRWLRNDQDLTTNLARLLTLGALFFASAQIFNSVTPERGLLHWLFSFFFLWTLWNNLFSSFDARRLLRSLTVLFGTSFVLKHLLLASLYAPEGGLLRRVAGAVLQGASLGTLDVEAFAPATGYISFFALALYVAGLLLIEPAPAAKQSEERREIVRAYLRLTESERVAVREAILEDDEDEATKMRTKARD